MSNILKNGWNDVLGEEFNKITNYSDATATNITFVEHYHAETRND